ncbi:12260_t:CDS:2, partial [Funneliformis caledonium]
KCLRAFQLDSDAAILIELKFTEGSFIIVENATNAVIIIHEENISEISKREFEKGGACVIEELYGKSIFNYIGHEDTLYAVISCIIPRNGHQFISVYTKITFYMKKVFDRNDKYENEAKEQRLAWEITKCDRAYFETVKRR